MVLEAAEGSCVEGAVVDEQPVDVPRVALPGRDPALTTSPARESQKIVFLLVEAESPQRAVPGASCASTTSCEARGALDPSWRSSRSSLP